MKLPGWASAYSNTIKWQRIRRRFTFLLLCSLISGSCGRDHAKTPLRAKIVVSGAKGYQLQEVTFNSLTDPDSVKGDYGEIVGNAVLKLDSDSEVLTGKSDHEVYLRRGGSVLINYIVKEGVLHPSDFDSASMLTLYYHYEKTVEFWADKLGLDPADFGQRRLFYDPDVASDSGIGSVTGTTKLNAAYFPLNQDFWFFKTSPLEKIPIKMNLGVLAHEFGHGIFDYKAAKRRVGFYSARNKASLWQLQGINEGISDYFSLMVTGRAAEFADSLDSFSKERVPPVSWTSLTLLKQPSICRGGFYCKGSVLASALYEVASLKGVGNTIVGKDLYAALEPFAEDWLALKDTSGQFDYYFLLFRILEQASRKHKRHYCDAFLKWFNDPINSEKVKKVCLTNAS